MGEREGQQIIDKVRQSDPNLGSAASFISGVGLSDGEAYALQVPVINGKKPDEGDIERYFKKVHHGQSVHDMIKELLDFWKADVSIENIQLLKDVFLNFFMESWETYQKDGKQYSAFFDSQGVYKEGEGEKLFNQAIEKIHPLDNSERDTGIRIKVSTREKLKKWGKSRGIERAAYDKILLDLLESKGIEKIDPVIAELDARENEILYLIGKGINTTEEMKDEIKEVSLRTIQKSVNSLVRKGVIFPKKRGNVTEYFIKMRD